MEQQIETPTRVEHDGERYSLLEGLTQPGGASLLFADDPGQPHPVLLMAVDAQEGLVIDITAVPGLAPRLARSEPFVLCGQVDGAMLRTPELTLVQTLETPGRLQFLCGYPEWLELLHRRSSFRAELRGDMPVRVELHLPAAEAPMLGRLLNLSLGGCLVELPAAEAVRLEGPQELRHLELKFPGGQSLALGARVCHLICAGDWQSVRFGCQFLGIGGDQERRLWLFVREIEREKARASNDSSRPLQPSSLFVQRSALNMPQPSNPLPESRIGRRLGRVAGYLDTQLIKLRKGESFDSQQLSRHSDLFLNLLDEARDEVLFAVQHNGSEPLLVQHGMAVAARLADLAQSRGLPRQVLKPLVGAALVHDFGKALLPAELRRACHLGAGQRRAFAAHVGLLRERLESCRWLAGPVFDAVLSINERLDGSGYPSAAGAAQLGELARMAAVVDVVDAMARPRADRPAMAIDTIYQHLQESPGQLDAQWVQRYIGRFGSFPIGTLVRFEGGKLAWVRRLDERGQIAQVQMTSADAPDPLQGGVFFDDVDLLALGPVDAILVPGG